MVARVAAAVGGGRHEEHEAKSEGEGGLPVLDMENRNLYKYL